MALDRGVVVGRAVARRQERRPRLEAQPHLEDVLDDLGVELRLQPPLQHVAVQQVPFAEGQHPGAGLRRHLDQPLARQALDRLAQGGPADAVGLAQLALDRQRIVRPELAGHDAHAQAVRDLGAHRPDQHHLAFQHQTVSALPLLSNRPGKPRLTKPADRPDDRII
jgi:hypothetical protein